VNEQATESDSVIHSGLELLVPTAEPEVQAEWRITTSTAGEGFGGKAQATGHQSKKMPSTEGMVIGEMKWEASIWHHPESPGCECRLFRREADLFEGFVEHAAAELEDGSDDDSSTSSSSSSCNNDSDLEEGEDGDCDLVVFTNTVALVARKIMQHAHKLLDPLEDEDVEFGQRKQIGDFNHSECKEHFWW